jgi:hypothetical protein
MLLLLGDGTRVPVAELPGDGPWTFLVLQPEDLPALVVDADPASAAGTAALERLPGRLGGGPGWAGIAPDAPPR